MIRDFLPMLVALALGLGTGTGIAMVTGGEHTDPVSATSDTTSAEHAAPPVASAAAPVHTDGPPVEAPTTEAPPATQHASPSVAPAIADTSRPADVRRQEQAAPNAQAPSSTPQPRPEVSDSTGQRELRRLGRIFAAMGPREAARVLVQLEDADVLTITRALTEKQVGAIFANFPPERAATLSRTALREHRTPKP